MKESEHRIITFRKGQESFFTLDIFLYVTWIGFMCACIGKYIFSHYYQYLYILFILAILLFALLMAYPSGCKYLYYRWLIFKYNNSTELVIDIDNKIFNYKHDNNEIAFLSEDVEKWSYGAFRTWNTTFVTIVRITLKNGKKIEISSGTGNVHKYLQENWELLGIPKGTYRYGDDFKSLQSYIKRINR